jgi:hypothetical protein
MKMAVFWVVAPWSLVEVYQRFRGTCCLHHQVATTQKTAIFMWSDNAVGCKLLPFTINLILKWVTTVLDYRGSNPSKDTIILFATTSRPWSPANRFRKLKHRYNFACYYFRLLCANEVMVCPDKGKCLSTLWGDWSLLNSTEWMVRFSPHNHLPWLRYTIRWETEAKSS